MGTVHNIDQGWRYQSDLTQQEKISHSLRVFEMCYEILRKLNCTMHLQRLIGSRAGQEVTHPAILTKAYFKDWESPSFVKFTNKLVMAMNC